MANGFAFISKDGKDDNGDRAEVYVQRGTGKISRLEPHENGKVANVFIKTEGLRFPTTAWVNVNDKTYPVLVQAFDDGKEVDYRVESQRKPTIDRKIPITPIRASEGDFDAKTDIKTILASVRILPDGELAESDEGVTDPAEDPMPGGRHSAREQNQAARDQNANQPVAPQNNQGAPVGGSDGRPFQRTNMDGSTNLDSFAALAAVGVETFMRRHLQENGWDATSPDFAREVYGYSMAVISAVDSIQQYLTRRPVDRAAHSHTRVRGIAFSTIEEIPLSLVHEGGMSKAEWHSRIGKVTLERMKMIMSIDQPQGQFDLNSFLGKQAPANATPQNDRPEHAPAERGQSAREPQNQQGDGVAVTDSDVRSLRPEPRTEDAPRPEARESANEEANLASIISRTSAPAPDASDASGLLIFEKRKQNGESHEVDAVVVSGLQDIMESGGIDKTDLAVMLRHSFDVVRVGEIDQDDLAEFSEFYDDAEDKNPGNMKQVVAQLRSTSTQNA